MKRILAAGMFIVALLIVGAHPASSQDSPPVGDIGVTVSPTEAQAVLGESIGFTVTVTNTGTAEAGDLVAHLDITDPTQEKSVDPEDWTPTLSRPLDPIAAGATATLTWEVQPISAGRFSLYSVVLRPGGSELTASNVVTIDVEDRRSLNPDGILPIALGVPIVVGGLLVGQIGYRRRSWRDD
jgi:uncharacterized repeat protein (TIGR01451 family)